MQETKKKNPIEVNAELNALYNQLLKLQVSMRKAFDGVASEGELQRVAKEKEAEIKNKIDELENEFY